VKRTATRFGISISQQFEQNAVVCCLLACVCGMTTPQLIQPVTPRNSAGATSTAIFARLGTQRLSPFFWPLKDALRISHFRSDDKVKDAVRDWLAQQPKHFSRGICAFLERWRMRADHGGDRTEYYCHYTVPIFVINYFM
jgi:hypothetical protein